MSEIKVKVGWWKQRCGHLVRIYRKLSMDAVFPWRDLTGSSYQDNGRFFNDEDDSYFDLVEYLGEVAEHEHPTYLGLVASLMRLEQEMDGLRGWWVDKKFGDVYFVIGKAPNGCIAAQSSEDATDFECIRPEIFAEFVKDTERNGWDS